jgi:peptidoglycan/LPS O-acetylase OafA/YrhL
MWQVRIIRVIYLGTFGILAYAFIVNGCLGRPTPRGEIIGICLATALWVYAAQVMHRGMEIWKRVAQHYASQVTRYPTFPTITLPKEDIERKEP